MAELFGMDVDPQYSRFNYVLSNDPDGRNYINLSWRDPNTGETLNHRTAIPPYGHADRNAIFRMAQEDFDRQVRRREISSASVQSMRNHPDESPHLREIQNLLGYFDNARRFSGVSMEVEQLVRVLTSVYRELYSQHCVITWLINREPPRQDERFQQLELRLTSLEETIDLFNNQE